MSANPTRPVMRYFGGKWRIAPWIISHFPPHRVYTEVFGGAASVLMRKQRSEVEVYNDLDQQVVNLFRVLRDDSTELERLLGYTPYSRDEYVLSQVPANDPIEQARRTLVAYWFSMSTDSSKNPPGSIGGFRSYSGRNLAKEWVGVLDTITHISERLRLVYIENDDAVSVLLRNDYPDALHYVDPPYAPSTRSSGGYRHDMQESEHEALAAALHQLEGMVILSGYDCPMYAELFPDWHRVDLQTIADSRRGRTESLWLNPAAQAKQPQPDLFAEVQS